MRKVQYSQEDYDLDISLQCYTCGRHILVDEWYLEADNFVEGGDLEICKKCIELMNSLC